MERIVLSSQSSHGDDAHKLSQNHHHGFVRCTRIVKVSKLETRRIKSPREGKSEASGAGKGDSRRLELSFIREKEAYKSIIEKAGHESSLQLVSGIINLTKNEWISKDAAHPYPAKYSDEHETRPIFEVDSHQTNTNGKKGKRYTDLIPCKFFVEANQIADTFCSLVDVQSKATTSKIKKHREMSFALCTPSNSTMNTAKNF